MNCYLYKQNPRKPLPPPYLYSVKIENVPPILTPSTKRNEAVLIEYHKYVITCNQYMSSAAAASCVSPCDNVLFTYTLIFLIG